MPCREHPGPCHADATCVDIWDENGLEPNCTCNADFIGDGVTACVPKIFIGLTTETPTTAPATTTPMGIMVVTTTPGATTGGAPG